MIYLINVNNLMIPSLSLATLKVSLNKYREETVIYDVEEDSRTALMNGLKDITVNDIVGFTVYSYNITSVLNYVDYLYEKLPELKIILGGPMVSSLRYSTELLKKHPGIDYIVRGRANRSFFRLIEQIYGKEYKSNSSKLNISNVSYRINGEPYAEDDQREETESFLQHSPWFEEGEYLLSRNILESDHGLPYSSAYGCHNRCSYCVESSQQFVMYPLERVKRELKLILSKKPKKIFFYDATFGYSRNRGIELMEFIAEHNRRTIISVYVNLDFLDEDYYLLASKAGVEFQGVGLQTVDSKTCSTIGRPEVDTEEMRRKINSDLFQFNTDVWIGIIYGLPGGSYSEFMKTMDFALSLRSNTNIGVYRYCYYPGTELFENNILYIPKSDTDPEIVSGPDMSAGEVCLANRIASLYWVLREAFPLFFMFVTWFEGIKRSSVIEAFSEAVWPHLSDSLKADIDDIAFANRAEESREKLEPLLEDVALNGELYAGLLTGILVSRLNIRESAVNVIKDLLIIDNRWRRLMSKEFRLLLESNRKTELFCKGLMGFRNPGDEETSAYRVAGLFRSDIVLKTITGILKLMSRNGIDKLQKRLTGFFRKDYESGRRYIGGGE